MLSDGFHTKRGSQRYPTKGQPVLSNKRAASVTDIYRKHLTNCAIKFDYTVMLFTSSTVYILEWGRGVMLGQWEAKR